MASKKGRSATRSAGSSAGSAPTRQQQAYLNPLLPPAWERYFTARHAGRYVGLNIACPHCTVQVPRGLKYSSRRWRWLAAHIATHKDDDQ